MTKGHVDLACWGRKEKSGQWIPGQTEDMQWMETEGGKGNQMNVLIHLFAHSFIYQTYVS